MTYIAMTKSKWLETALANKDALRSLIQDYHPASQAQTHASMPITAPNAEIACANVRQSIAAEDAIKAPPVERFDKAIADGDVGLINELLSAAWIGVPESAACWGIPGFSVACDLLDDPPQDERV